jgi:hypothetical protein
MLQLTGPVTVPSWPEPITVDNVVKTLLLDQYANVRGDERGEFQGEVAQAVWEKLTAGDFASADELVDALAPAVRGRRVQVFSAAADEQSFFVRVGAAGTMAPVRGDYLGVVTQNFGGNKIDWFLRREISYDLTYDPETRQASGTVRIVLHNDAPTEGYSALVIDSIEGFTAEPGTNRTWLDVYTALPVTDATVDGEPLALERGQELGRNVYATELVLASRTTTTVELEVRGALRDGDDAYRLDVLGQPVVGNDRLTVTVRDPAGRLLAGSGEAALQEGARSWDAAVAPRQFDR